MKQLEASVSTSYAGIRRRRADRRGAAEFDFGAETLEEVVELVGLRVLRRGQNCPALFVRPARSDGGGALHRSDSWRPPGIQRVARQRCLWKPWLARRAASRRGAH